MHIDKFNPFYQISLLGSCSKNKLFVFKSQQLILLDSTNIKNDLLI